MIARLKNRSTGIVWTLRLVPVGGLYGLNNQLVNETGKAQIEFYDFRHKFNTSPSGDMLGQFVSRYYVDTIFGRCPNGLCLDGGISAWNLDAESMRLVDAILRNWTQTA